MRREKLHGYGRTIPLDRNDKARLWLQAQLYNRRHRRRGQGLGPLSRCTLAVLDVLLFGFHNATTGRCFPGREAVANRARVCLASVDRANAALEAAGLMTWHHRIYRAGRRILRSSNAYRFAFLTESQFSARTETKVIRRDAESRDGHTLPRWASSPELQGMTITEIFARREARRAAGGSVG